ncbi:MAG TPA: hypothetical protein VK641_15305 [Terriglobales bacterium]|nr:hypothetical protein [Terriglobales bacterium]
MTPTRSYEVFLVPLSPLTSPISSQGQPGGWPDAVHGLTLPPCVRCRYDSPVEVRFPVASDGMHYPRFSLETQQVVYNFEHVDTVAADWSFTRRKGKWERDQQLSLLLVESFDA